MRTSPTLGVSLEDAYDGPVVVKTDLNAGGVPQRIARRRSQPEPARLVGTLLDHARRVWNMPSSE